MAGIIENIIIMILTVLVLIGGGYLTLVILNLGLKLRGKTLEDEGLLELWAQTQKEQNTSDDPKDPTDDHSQ